MEPKTLEELIEEFFHVKYEQKARRVKFIGPDRVFNELPTEKAVNLYKETLIEQIQVESRK